MIDMSSMKRKIVKNSHYILRQSPSIAGVVSLLVVDIITTLFWVKNKSTS